MRRGSGDKHLSCLLPGSNLRARHEADHDTIMTQLRLIFFLVVGLESLTCHLSKYNLLLSINICYTLSEF